MMGLTIGVVMADSVENILHLWRPLFWASHIPSNQASNGHTKWSWEIP